MRNGLIAICLALLLVACIQTPPGQPTRDDPQAFANQTSVRAQFGPDNNITGFEWDDGKQKASIKVEANIKDGTFKYEATDVTQLIELSKIRAEANAAFNASVTEAQRQALAATLGEGGISGIVDRLAAAMAAQRGL